MKTDFTLFTFSILILLNNISYSQIINPLDSSEAIPNQYHRGVTPQINFPISETPYNTENLRKMFPLEKVNSNIGIWSELNPKVPRVDYYSVYFKDELNGFAVGEFGAIVKTTDGGATWADKSFPTAKTLLRIMGYNNFVVIVGTGGTILRSIDFGESWENINLVANVDIWGVYTFTDSLSMICTKDGQLLKTYDTGNNWQIDTIGFPLTYWDLKFMNQETGFISCSDGIILKTTNGGNSWTIKQTGDLYSLYSVEILPNGSIITAGSSGQIYYSTDSGETFAPSVVPITFIIEDLAFANNNIGIAIGQATMTNAILKTTDGGLNWDLLNKHMGHLNVDFITDSIGYNVGIDLKIYKSSDQGSSWNLQLLNDNLYDIEFISESTGFVISGALYKTNDGGETWNKLPAGAGGYSLVFIDSLTGFVGNDNAIINKTTNGGLSWYTTNQNPGGGRIKKIRFSNNTVGWALSDNLYKSTNTGESWVQVLSGTIYNDFFFLDSLNGWVVGNGVHKTTDGGINWELINPTVYFYNVEFIDIDTGYAASGSIYKTTDGGFTWILINGVSGQELEVIDSSMIITLDTQGIIYLSTDSGNIWLTYNVPIGRALKFVNKSRGYFVGDLGLIYEYFDSTYVPVELKSFYVKIEGEKILLKWETASELNNRGFEIQKRSKMSAWGTIGFVEGNGTTTDYNVYSFVDNNLKKGVNYYRLKQLDYDGGYSFSEEVKIEVTVPLLFILKQNYPNPFNPKTKICFNLSETSKITLKIFDSLGREIKTLINKEMIAGYYDIDFNALGYSSGIYLYSLKAEGVNGESAISVKKMIFIK